ncbi:hypothetical protein NFI96_030907, partial [Prochilodus magdalenae]
MDYSLDLYTYRVSCMISLEASPDVSPAWLVFFLSLFRLHTAQRAIKQTQVTVQRIGKEIEEKLRTTAACTERRRPLRNTNMPEGAPNGGALRADGVGGVLCGDLLVQSCVEISWCSPVWRSPCAVLCGDLLVQSCVEISLCSPVWRCPKKERECMQLRIGVLRSELERQRKALAREKDTLQKERVQLQRKVCKCHDERAEPSDPELQGTDSGVQHVCPSPVKSRVRRFVVWFRGQWCVWFFLHLCAGDVLSVRCGRPAGALVLWGWNAEEAFSSKHQKLEAERETLADLHKECAAKRELFLKSNAQLTFRCRQLLSELSYIYPIDVNNQSDYVICGVKLPNSEDFQAKDDGSVAVALGYTAHLVLMISCFLQIPLRYPLIHRGSRSSVRDTITDKLSEKER